MNTASSPNRDALRQGLDVYRDGMRAFILRCFRRVKGKRVEDAVCASLGDWRANEVQRHLQQGADLESAIDVNDFPQLVNRQWHEIFCRELNDDPTVRNVMWIIADARNRVAHPGRQDMDAESVQVLLFHLADVLGRIKNPAGKQAVADIRNQLSRPLPPQSASATRSDGAHAAKRAARAASGTLKPWRDVIRPNADVQHGSFREAEFAANLQQVNDGRAGDTLYGNPVHFFNHTYITPGIRTLLVNALRRLAGQGGDPVIQTKTGFGGGKTHSLIALYHLVNHLDTLSHASTGDSSGSQAISGILAEAQPDPDAVTKVAVAVLDGTHLSPTDARTTPAGDPLNTLWGEIAWQLGGQAAYDIVGEAARTGTAPGSAQLDELFRRIGPCLILMDELVAYVRNVPPGQVGSVYTFLQALGQSASGTDNVALVVTLPESELELGGELGQQALGRLEHIFGRIEAVWEPLEISEAFAVVRQRLFGDVMDEAERDRTCEAFARIYAQNRSEYLAGVSESRYLQRMKDCYPIHPEIFDRLYADWSSIPQFQRTRGVLRMMSNCISYLYRHNDAGPLIMPAHMPLRDSALAHEFHRLLPGQWQPVLSEADSDDARTDQIDASMQRFAEVGGAARRLARTIFLGSAPSGAIRGIDRRQILLGVVQPGHGVSAYNDALQRMTGKLYYLYADDGRYYFHAEENLNKVASDRADQLNVREVEESIVQELREAVGRRRDVIVCPPDSAAVPEKESVHLVILPPDKALPSRSAETDEATPLALEITQNRGDAPRMHRNALLYLTAKSDEIRALRSASRVFLAWDSIVNGNRRIGNLTGDRRRQATSSLRGAREKLDAALVKAYQWVLAPVQEKPDQAAYRMSVLQTRSASSGDIANEAWAKCRENEVLVDEVSPGFFANVLQRYIWNHPHYQDHIELGALWKMMTDNVYMPRLRNKGVLVSCLEKGVRQDKFNYTVASDGNGYQGFQSENSAEFSLGELRGLLISPEMAQLLRESMMSSDQNEDSEYDTNDETAEANEREDEISPPPPCGPKRIVATKSMSGEISLDDTQQLSDEIIRCLRDDGGEVTIQITIEAHKEDGFSDNVVRVARENSVQLGLDYQSSD